MKRAIAGTILATWLLSTGVVYAARPVTLVASQYSDRYHLSSCKVAKKIRPQDLHEYKNPEEALEAGLVACKKCYPPTTSEKWEKLSK